jgi:mitochondrial fission protein ELM1
MPDDIARLPSPRVAVLVGGASREYRYTPEATTRLAQVLGSLARLGAGLMITPSRRTPATVMACVEEATARAQRIVWRGEGDNPYPQFLAHADCFIAPADSINMTGEPCATGRPVYVFQPDGGSPKFARFHAGLARHGATRPCPERFERLESWNYPPIFSAGIIAAEIARRWAARRRMLGARQPAQVQGA